MPTCLHFPLVDLGLFFWIWVKKKQKNNSDPSAAAHLRGPGEPVCKPADYLWGPVGSRITPTQTPAVKHILLTCVFLPAMAFCPVVRLSFCISGLPRHLQHSRTFFFKLVFLSSHSFFCFPLTVSQAESQPDASPAPAVQAFHKTWQEEDGEPGLRKKKWIRALEVCWNWQNTLD